MGDSEDEFDRQRREKFRRERGDYERRGERDWSRERPRGWNGGSGPDMKRSGMRPPPGLPGDQMQRRRPDFPVQPPHDVKRRFSPGREEEMRARKRMRGFEPGFQGNWPPGPAWEPGRPGFRPPDEWGQGDRMGPHSDMDKLGPRMLTFKQWLGSQPDDITDEEAIKNYTEYKISFKRQQLQQFFIAHKEEEWFKEKYHPDESGKRETDHQKAVRWRADVFKTLVEKGFIDDVGLDLINENKIVKVLDAAVIFMEGGTDDDLKALDQPAETADSNAPNTESDLKKNDDKENGVAKTEEGELAEDKAQELKVDFLTEEQHELKKQAELYKQLVADKNEPTADGDNDPDSKDKKKKKKRGRDKYAVDEEGSSSSSGNSSSSESDNEEKKKDPGPDEKVEGGNETTETLDDAAVKNEPSEENPPEEEKKEEAIETVARPRALHQTYSIFMRNLPPSVTRNDIINLCKTFPGFIRVAFSQPIDDHNRFIRRCWVTFDRNVNIKDICWNLNNIRLRELELNPVVNRDLARRVRPISGIAQHKTCARNDLKCVARLIMHLDKKMKLWEKKVDETTDAEEPTTDAKTTENQSETNPWLVNISEFLVDESSAEEDQLLGGDAGMKQNEESEMGGVGASISIQRDEKLIQQLDRLLYYLRLVHSVDYYNASQYPNEDEMPNRCGIVHARGPIPPNKLSRDDIAEFQKRFNEKLVPILDFKDKLTKEEAAKLGLKDETGEVEKFVTSNTQELGKDKWLCPLSGKKFKGPDYVRKHIFNKHGEKVDGVKKEVAYYNNYLLDPFRPGPPEGQRAASAGPTGPGLHPPGPGGYGAYGARPPMYGNEPGRAQFSTPQFHHRPPPAAAYGNGRTYPPKQRDMRPREPFSGRQIIEYRDLDAPDDGADFF